MEGSINRHFYKWTEKRNGTWGVQMEGNRWGYRWGVQNKQGLFTLKRDLRGEGHKREGVQTLRYKRGGYNGGGVQDGGIKTLGCHQH